MVGFSKKICYNIIRESIRRIFTMIEKKCGQPCVLYERDCIGCLECETCDLDPNKVCDNCGKCIDIQDVASIKIDKIYMNPDDYKEE